MSSIIINGRFLTQRVTGVQRYASQVIDELDRLLKAGVINYSKNPLGLISPAKRLYKPDYQQIHVDWLGSFTGHFWEQIELPGYIHDALLWSPANTGPLRVRNQVVTIHDASVLDKPQWFRSSFSLLYRFLIPKLIQRTLHIITDSEFSKARLLLYGKVPNRKITVVPLGVADFFAPASHQQVVQYCQQKGLPEKYLLVVGSLDPRKNLSGLLMAWSRICAQMPDIHLVVVGAGGRAFRSLSLDGSLEKVIFLGYVDDRELPLLYSGALAYLFPSLYEGFGLMPLEAMACGTPVMTSNTTSLPEVVGDDALLVNPHDIDSIAQGITQIIEDSNLRDALRQKGFERVKQFKWEKTALKIWDVLQSQMEASA